MPIPANPLFGVEALLRSDETGNRTINSGVVSHRQCGAERDYGPGR